jgi:hypothetical protein
MRERLLTDQRAHIPALGRLSSNLSGILLRCARRDGRRRMTIRARGRRAVLFLKTALLVTLLAIAALSVACADTRTARMDAWRGKPIEDLITQWGAPNSTAQLKDGRTVYSWITVYSIGRSYRTSFTTSKDGIIEDWAYHDATIPAYPK